MTIIQQRKKVLLVFHDIIADMEANEKLSAIANELFLSSRKLNISLIFVSQSYFKVTKPVRLNATLILS